MKDLILSFQKSLACFKEVLAMQETVIVRDASIQRFEFTVELAWKVLQKYLREERIICRSPRQCLKEAFKLGLIEDNPKWLEMIDDRNLTSHTYKEETAQEIFKRLPDYLRFLEELATKF